MLTEQNTPLPLVRQWSNLIPHCWESLDELTAKIRATQPSNMAAEAEPVCSYEHCTGTRCERFSACGNRTRII